MLLITKTLISIIFIIHNKSTCAPVAPAAMAHKVATVLVHK